MSTAEPSTPPREPKRRDVEFEQDHALTIPNRLIEAVTIIDPGQIRKLRADRIACGLDRRDEMWDGIYVMSPDANYEHQFLVGELMLVFGAIRHLVGGADILPGLNVSDRVQGWQKNYRVPDIAVYFLTNPAQNCGTHRCGGPDFAVEILSENDLARKKLDFYAKVGTRELLMIERDEWALELYRLTDGKLEIVGISTLDQPETLTSEVLPLTLRLVPGESRPTLELCRLDGGQSWRI